LSLFEKIRKIHFLKANDKIDLFKLTNLRQKHYKMRQNKTAIHTFEKLHKIQTS